MARKEEDIATDNPNNSCQLAREYDALTASLKSHRIVAHKTYDEEPHDI